MELLERDEQLGELAAVVERSRRGQGTTVLVSGEAGIGKTTLMRELVRRQAEGVRPIWATCEDLLTPRPLGPLLDLFDEHQAGEVGKGPHRRHSGHVVAVGDVVRDASGHRCPRGRPMGR